MRNETRGHVYVALFIPASSLLFTMAPVYTERHTHVHRTPYARTPNAIRMYTERCTCVQRTTYVATPA